MHGISLNRGLGLISVWALFNPASKRQWFLTLYGISFYLCMYSSRSSFLQVIFCTVYSSKLESGIVALSLEHNGDQCICEIRTWNWTIYSCCTYTWLTIIEWVGPGLNSKPGLYLLKYTINPPASKWNRLLFGGGLYSR